MIVVDAAAVAFGKLDTRVYDVTTHVIFTQSTRSLFVVGHKQTKTGETTTLTFKTLKAGAFCCKKSRK